MRETGIDCCWRAGGSLIFSSECLDVKNNLAATARHLVSLRRLRNFTEAAGWHPLLSHPAGVMADRLDGVAEMVQSHKLTSGESRAASARLHMTLMPDLLMGVACGCPNSSLLKRVLLLGST